MIVRDESLVKNEGVIIPAQLKDTVLDSNHQERTLGKTQRQNLVSSHPHNYSSHASELQKCKEQVENLKSRVE